MKFYTLEESLVLNPLSKESDLKYCIRVLEVAKKNLRCGDNVEYWKYLMAKLEKQIKELKEITMKEDQSKLLEKIIIKGSMKPSWHNSAGYKVELNGVKFFSPFECFNAYVLGEGDNEHKVRVNDETYIKIKSWIQEKIVPYLCKGGNKVCSSYGIKHMAEDQLGFYVSNETVKIIMCELGVIKKRNKVQWDINLYYPYKGIIGIEKYERM